MGIGEEVRRNEKIRQEKGINKIKRWKHEMKGKKITWNLEYFWILKIIL